MGIDCSSKSIDLVVLDENRNWVDSASFVSKSKDMHKRLVELGKQFWELMLALLNLKCEYFVVIENSIFIQNAKSSIGISQMVGSIKNMLGLLDVECIGVDNKTWKKNIVGSGSANKPKIMEFAKGRFNDNITSQDIADSACIALFGVMRLGESDVRML